MPISPRIRREKLIAEAEGFLSLDMSAHALKTLDRVEETHWVSFAVHFLRGEAYRNLGQHEPALESYSRALKEQPENVGVLMAMAWCYKRTEQLPTAIDIMQQAYHIAPTQPIVLYNMACYWSLSGNKSQALSWLGRALRMDQKLRKLIADETDFDRLREDPDFELIISVPDNVSGNLDQSD